MTMRLILLRFTLLLLFLAPSTWTVSDVQGSTHHDDMDVNLLLKSPVLEGDDLELKCIFTVPDGTTVASLKWYKGSREIFRYEHKPVPKKQILQFGNLTIDEDRSSIHLLYIKRVPAFMSGKISCEVTLEDPSAKTVTKSAKLLVAVPPTEGPALEASLIQYSHNNVVHQKLIANCTSSPSKPATNLTIYFNNSPVNSSTERIRKFPDILVNNNFFIRRIELELDLNPQHFIDGKVFIKCASTLFDLHRNMSDEYVLEQEITASTRRHNSRFIGIRLRNCGFQLLPDLNHLNGYGGIATLAIIYIINCMNYCNVILCAK